MPNPHRKILLSLLLLAPCALALMVAINVIIDPFWRFDLITLPHINTQRPMFAYAGRMAKAEEVCRIRPTQIVMGGSRVEVGFDPTYPAWNDLPGPVYNLGLSGLPLHELFLTFQHAVNTSPIKRAVIGLDFIMFNQMREDVVFKTEVIDFDARRLVLGPWDSCAKSFLYDADTLIGLKALRYSLQTVTKQHNPSRATDDPSYWVNLYAADGFRRTFPLGLGKSAGFGLGHLQEEYYVEKIWRPAPEHLYCFGNTMSEFWRFVQFARLHHVDMRFYLEPMHARMLLAIADAGLWPQYEEWQRAMAIILGRERYPLWDFGSFNAVTEDEANWWEPSHYRREVGDLMLDRMLGYHQERVPSDFGVTLTPENVEPFLAHQRQTMTDYQHKEPEASRSVAAAVVKVLAKTPSVGACSR